MTIEFRSGGNLTKRIMTKMNIQTGSKLSTTAKLDLRSRKLSVQ